MARKLQPSSAPSLIVRPANQQDVDALSARLRPADRAELLASVGFDDPALLLSYGLQVAAVCMVAETPDGHPMVLFGVTLPETPDWPFATYFMVAAEGVERYSRQIVREAHHWVAAMQRATGNLPGHNAVDCRNTLHIRWLRWLGAAFTGRVFKRADPSTDFLEFILPCVTP